MCDRQISKEEMFLNALERRVFGYQLYKHQIGGWNHLIEENYWISREDAVGIIMSLKGHLKLFKWLNGEWKQIDDDYRWINELVYALNEN